MARRSGVMRELTPAVRARAFRYLERLFTDALRLICQRIRDLDDTEELAALAADLEAVHVGLADTERLTPFPLQELSTALRRVRLAADRAGDPVGAALRNLESRIMQARDIQARELVRQLTQWEDIHGIPFPLDD